MHQSSNNIFWREMEPDDTGIGDVLMGSQKASNGDGPLQLSTSRQLPSISIYPALNYGIVPLRQAVAFVATNGNLNSDPS
jgi:hypothetical protein